VLIVDAEGKMAPAIGSDERAGSSKGIELNNEREAAEQLRAEPCTLKKWRFLNKGPAFLKLSGKIYYRQDDIEAFIAAARVVPGRAHRRRKSGAK
jgi:hypothetical protein